MRLVLDAGALIAIDRRDARIAGILELGQRAGSTLVTIAPVVGQAWRDGARQANLARALAMIEVQEVTLERAQRAGELLGRNESSDIVDALLVESARASDRIVTSDPADVSRLVETQGVGTAIIRV